MIQSNKGTTKIEGTGADFLFELNSIFEMLLDEQPELLTAVVTAWTPAIEANLEDMDVTLLKCIYKVSSRWANDCH